MKDTKEKIKIARIATIPDAFVHIHGLLQYFEDNLLSTHELTLISDFDLETNYSLDHFPHVKKISIKIPREISPFKDLRAIISLYLIFIKFKFEIVHSSTPKAGLLVAISAYLAGIKNTFHTFTGQRWATLNGFLRLILKYCDVLIIFLSTKTYADSFSQIDFLVEEKVTTNNKIKCLLHGSYGGINLNRFDRNKIESKNPRINLFNELKIPLNEIDTTTIILFVGRVNKEKGIKELVESFVPIPDSLPQSKIYLVIVGPFEENIELLNMKKEKNIFILGQKNNPEDYMSACDFFVLPSYREGFGTVIIEAASLGKCSIGTNIPGLKDSIVDKQTGILVPLHDIEALRDAMKLLIKDKKLTKSLGENSYQRVLKYFDSRIISKAVIDEYATFL